MFNQIIFFFGLLCIFFFGFLYFSEVYKLTIKKKKRIISFIMVIISLLGLGLVWFKIFYAGISLRELWTTSSSGLILCAQGAIVLWLGLILATASFLLAKKVDKIRLLFLWIISRSLIVVFLIFISIVTIITLETRIRNTFVISEPVLENKIDTVSSISSEEDCEFGLFIPDGGSICGTLGVTKEEAMKIAKINNLPYHYQGKKLIVIVQPEDEFIRVGRVWYMSDKD